MIENNQNNLEEFVLQHYLQILKRKPSDEEIKIWVKRIEEGEVKTEELVKIFISSSEYIDLKQKNESIENIGEQMKVFLNSTRDQSSSPDETIVNEPEHIFVTCFNNSTRKGGIYHLVNDALVPISEGYDFRGMYYEKKRKILFAINETNKSQQIYAFKIDDNEIKQLQIKFNNYTIASAAHGILVFKNKIIAIAPGRKHSKQNVISYAGPSVGEIIASEIDFNDNEITIKNSTAYNPFNCPHHHHINDLCNLNGVLYLSSFSYCNDVKEVIHKGAISKLDKKFQVNSTFEVLEHPHSITTFKNHSITTFKNRLYTCSSATASVISYDPTNNRAKLEYKGANAYARGLLVTQNYFYIGYSVGIGRTNSPFNNKVKGILKFNNRTGETIRIPLPEDCDNVYMITSD